jgi:hypothetical protein
MSLLHENIIPGNHGKVFSTNAMAAHDLDTIKARILELEGVKDVQLNFNVFPREFTIYTSKLITVEEVQEKVISTGYHSIPKDLFEL